MTASRLRAPEPAAPVEPIDTPPAFSVVICAYQASEVIGESIRSVLAQTAPAFEVIVSDDGSTDPLEDALAPFGDALRVVRRPHGGVASARNAGAFAARGDFVLIHDADDVMLPRKLEALGELACARPDLDLLSTDVFFEQDGRRAGRFSIANPFAVRDQRTAIFDRCFVGWPAARRAALLAAGGFDESMPHVEDWDCWMRMVRAGSAAGLYDEPLSVYRIHPQSVSSTSRAHALRNRVLMLERVGARERLDAGERAALERAIAAARTRAALAEAEEALRDGRRDRRRRAFAVAREPGASVRMRLGAAAASAAPGLARRWLRRFSRRSPLERSVHGGPPP